METRLEAVGLLSVHTSPLEQPGVGDSGGMNVAVLSLARRLAATGLRVEMFTRRGSGDLPATVTVSEGVRLHHVDAGTPALPKQDLASHLCGFYLGLAGHPAVEGLDLLHAHYWMSGWVGRQARRRLGLPLVQSFHTLGKAKNDALAPGDVPEPALRLAAEDRVVAAADAVIASTHEEASLLRRRYRAAPGKVHVVPLGVDLTVFRADLDRNAARQALGGGRIVLFAGRLQPLKAPDLAVETLAALDDVLPADGVPARLVIVGGPSGVGAGDVDPPGLAALAERLGVGDRVAFLAPRPQHELAALYAAADVVLVPSHSESFGLVALEALACGTPVVGAPVGGLAQLLAGGGGAIVDRRDPAAFAVAAAPYLVDPRARAAAWAAAQRAAAAYSWEGTAEQTIGVYRTAVDGIAEPAAQGWGA